MVRIDPLDKGELKQDVGRRLLIVRTHYKLGQEEFAERLGLSQPRYSQYESGKRIMPPDVAANLWDAFLITTDYIYRGEPGALPADLWQNMQKVIKALEN